MAPMKIAVMLESVQLGDIMGIDLLGNCSTQYINSCEPLGYPVDQLLPHTKEMEFFYLATTLDKPFFMTPSLSVNATHTYDSCPRDVDILLVGGPLPTHRPESSLKFMQEVKAGTILTTCIGSLWLASSGVLDGKKATTNREALKLAKQFHPNVEWMDQRWVVDGNIWSSGGAQAGMFMGLTIHCAIAGVTNEVSRNRYDRYLHSKDVQSTTRENSVGFIGRRSECKRTILCVNF